MLEAPSLQRPWFEANHSPPNGAKVKQSWSYILTSPPVFMAWCMITGRTLYFTFIYVGTAAVMWNLVLLPGIYNDRSSWCYFEVLDILDAM